MFALEPEKLDDDRDRDIMYREVESFKKHCIGWEDISLLDQYPKYVATLLMYGAKKRKE